MLKVRQSRLLTKTGRPALGSPVGQSQPLTSLPVFPAYPWDRSSLKSMALDLRQFEKLDTYASQVGELAPLPVCPPPLKTAWSVLTQGGKASARPS